MVLHESGARHGDPFAPYQRLEAQPSSGLAMVVSARPDEEFHGCVHEIEVLRIETGTGQLARAQDATTPASQELGSESERERAVLRLQRELALEQD